jgi:DNA-binding transcriptional regulator LsrR (DeoR family)
MLLVRRARWKDSAMPADDQVAVSSPEESGLAEVVHAMHQRGTSQRAIARELNIDRRKVKRVLGIGTER